MPNAGFRGNILKIDRLTILGRQTGPVVQFHIQFSSADGIVYAITQHEIELGVNVDIQTAAAELIGALTRWAERTHFTVPQDATTTVRGAIRGIAEQLQGPDGSDDDPGSEG